MAVVQGVVKSFNPARGWGFIQYNGEEIFMCQEECQAYAIEAGMPVQFTIGESTRHPGKAAATNVQVISQTQDGSDIEVFFGEVKSFNQQKGWGFLASEASTAKYGKDILILRHETTSMRHEVPDAGSPCSFQVTQGEKGWIATHVQFSGIAFDRARKMHATMSDGADNVFFGEVKSFNPVKGFGFLTSEAATATYGKDVLVLKNEIPGGVVEKGTPCKFQVMQGSRGVLATKVKLLDGNSSSTGAGAGDAFTPAMWDCVMAMMGGSGGKGGMGGKSGMGAKGGMSTKGSTKGAKGSGKSTTPVWQPMFQKQAKGKGSAMSKGTALPVSDETFMGTVKSFNPVKGWGFLSSEASMAKYGKDILILRHEASSERHEVPEPGTACSFKVTQGDNGWIATQVQFWA